MGSWTPSFDGKIETRLFINNEFVPSVSGKTFQLFNPATEQPSVTVSEAGQEDVDIAVKHAKAAWEDWFDRDASDRSAALVALGELIIKNTSRFAELEALSMGTPTMFYHLQTSIAGKLLNYFAGIASDVHGDSSLMSKDHLNITLKQPYGVVAAIIPWNVPILMALNKIAPAVAAGNAIILKSSEKAPLTSILLAQLIAETGLFPPGIVQVLSGAGACGASLASHPEIRKIAFTGSTRTGQLVKSLAANSNLKACTLECGGKAPLILFEDGNLERAAKESAISCAFNAGQTCTSVARIYVHETLVEPFLAQFRPVFEGFLAKAGDPLDPSVTHGPQADKLQFSSVMSFIEGGKKTGSLLSGGNRRGEKGYFIEPTIFLNAPDESEIVRKEIFGPVMNIMTFKDETEVMTRVNDSEYGLFASVYTKDISRALRVAKKYESGTVSINCTSHYQAVDMAFGGVKGSGDGREYGRWGLDSWLEIKSVLIDVTG